MNQGLFGALHLGCRMDARGESFLDRQFCQPPFHVGKGYRDGRLLSVQVANPATGVFCGDSLSVKVEVDHGNLRVSTPASTSLFPGKGVAKIRQSLRISGGWLEWAPEPLIPHARSCLDQALEISIEEGGTFWGVEVLTPGRVARNESLAFEQLTMRTALRLEGHLIARERFALAPPTTNWVLERFEEKAAYVATGWAVFATPPELTITARLEALQSDSLKLGATLLDPRVLVVRLAARESVSMRRGVAQIRECLAELLPHLRVPFRRF